MEAADDVTALLKRTPAELAYNKALERNIDLHKDLEFLITSIRKRRNEALEMLDILPPEPR
jgi:BarA-like signal transduction histidine kinase